MPYMNESALAYYDPKLKEWISSQPVKTIPSSLYPWTLTDKAGAVTCWPVGGTELKPTVDFLFTETGPAEGTKGPDNPSTITGVSSITVTRCGKNLCPNVVTDVWGSGIEVTKNTDGSLTFNGSTTNNCYVYVFNIGSLNTKEWPRYLKKGGTYTFSMNGDDGVAFEMYHTKANGSFGGYNVYITPGQSATYTFPIDRDGLLLRYKINANTTVSNCRVKVQIEEGSTVTAFEPYNETDYAIPFGNTYYGGEIDLATGLMTVTWEAVPAAGALSFYWSDATTLSNVAIFRASLPHFHTSLSTCNKFIAMSGSQDNADSEHYRLYGPSGTSGAIQFWISKSRFSGLSPSDDGALWRTAATGWMASNNVVVAYELAAPYTVQLSPLALSALAQTDKYTPCLNTVYSDQQAVQVGYIKSPIRNEFELQQAVVGLGGNI